MRVLRLFSFYSCVLPIQGFSGIVVEICSSIFTGGHLGAFLSIFTYVPFPVVAVLAFYNSMACVSDNIQISNQFTVNELNALGFRWPKPGILYLRHFKKI